MNATTCCLEEGKPLKKADCIELTKNVIKLKMKIYIPHSMMYDDKVLLWHCTTMAFTENPRSWAMTKLVSSICDFDTILHSASICKDRNNDILPPAIVEFQRFIIGVYKEAEVTAYELLHYSTCVKLGTQKGSRKFQDNVDMALLNSNLVDVENCAYCKHIFVIPIGLDINEITSYNAKIAKRHNNEMKIWTNMTTGKRSSKPRPGKYLSQHLEYMCVHMRRSSRMSGSGCIRYKASL